MHAREGSGDEDGRGRLGEGRAPDVIFSDLMARILAGQITPGTILSELAIADAYRVSRTPVREALQRLQAAGLAERGPRRAFMVRRLDLETLNDLFETMGELEAVCAELSARRMTAVERRELQAIVAEGAACAERGDAAAYVDVNVRFHAALFAGAHNDSLRDVVTGVRMRTAPYREVQFHHTERLNSSQEEHARILAAILAGDPVAARESTRAHVASTAINVAQMLRRAG
ncbi:GntR family transcriptional regulator [uncultured Alphaproteobacteria bacterium]|uniref:GntR family transcriptional regulator n=1 Tax=uncultured Alphaproteobacteria bacterium TaxID=91750 RepID=A0A212KJ17_9PROT|nr:GntR family transcriptional regulator [uncultured Alphaproteobacteria bacterium]